MPFSEPEGASCTAVTDAVSLAGLSVSQQTLWACDVYGDALAQQPMEGIIGLGPSDAGGHFLWNLYNSGQLLRPEYSIFEIPGASHGSEITLGGTNPSRFQGPITTVPLDKEQSQRCTAMGYEYSRSLRQRSLVAWGDKRVEIDNESQPGGCRLRYFIVCRPFPSRDRSNYWTTVL